MGFFRRTNSEKTRVQTTLTLDIVIVSITTATHKVKLKGTCPFTSNIVILAFNWTTLILLCVPFN